MKLLNYVILLFLIPNFGFAQKKTNTLLWEVSHPNSNYKSYLLGTFHEVNPDLFDASAKAVNYLKKSDILFVENYENDPPTIESKKNPAQLSIAQPWTKDKWLSYLSKKQHNTLEEFFKSKWIDESMFELNPAATLFIFQSMYLQGIVDTADRSSYQLMDHRIIQRAEEQNKNIKSLDLNIDEELQQEFDTNKEFKPKNLVKANMLYVEYIMGKNINTPAARFLIDYKNQSLDYELNKRPRYRHLIDTRNEKWLAVLKPAFLAQNCFVAVGVKHLYYKQGLISSLREAGFQVRPVFTNSKT